MATKVPSYIELQKLKLERDKFLLEKEKFVVELDRVKLAHDTILGHLHDGAVRQWRMYQGARIGMIIALISGTSILLNLFWQNIFLAASSVLLIHKVVAPVVAILGALFAAVVYKINDSLEQFVVSCESYGLDIEHRMFVQGGLFERIIFRTDAEIYLLKGLKIFFIVVVCMWTLLLVLSMLVSFNLLR